MEFQNILPAIALSLAIGAAHADVFKCVDEDGSVTYTNAKSGKNCKALSSDLPVSSVPSNAPAKKATPTPGSFPKVDGDTQRTRDNDRRKILENELAAEQKALEAAKKELGDAESAPETFRLKGGGTGRNVAAYEEKVKPLQDKAALHERNIEALKKEIGNLR
jgi:hypothetical protein